MNEPFPRMKASIRPSGDRSGYTAESVKKVSCFHSLLAGERLPASDRKEMLQPQPRTKPMQRQHSNSLSASLGVSCDVAEWDLEHLALLVRKVILEPGPNCCFASAVADRFAYRRRDW